MVPATQKAHDEIHGLKAVRGGLNELWHLAEYAPNVRAIVETTRRQVDKVAMELADYILLKERACRDCPSRIKSGDSMM